MPSRIICKSSERYGIGQRLDYERKNQVYTSEAVLFAVSFAAILAPMPDCLTTEAMPSATRTAIMVTANPTTAVFETILISIPL